MIVTATVATAAAGLLAAGVTYIALVVWPPRGAKLPDPVNVPWMPMAGPALQKAADAAINRKHRGGG